MDRKRLALAAAWLTLLGGVAAAAESAIVGILDSEALYIRGRHLQSQRQPRLAIESYEAAVAKGGADRWARRSVEALAGIYLGSGPYHNTGRAIAVLEHSALSGNLSAAGRLISIQLDRKGEPRELRRLIPAYRQLAEESSSSAAILLGRLAEEGRVGRKADATGWYRLAAERGSQTAMRRLAVLYVNQGAEDKAGYWIGRMAKGEAVDFYLNVAKDYLAEGDEMPADMAAALKWYRKALDADAGRAVASAGRFIDAMSESDRRVILAAAREMADAGNADAALLAGRLIEEGGSEAGSDEALAYYIRAVEGGNDEALAELTRAAGFLGADDPRSAKILAAIEGAAGRGNALAMLTLGNVSSAGTLVERDLEAGLAWYLKAAEAGNAEGQFRAGMAFAQGLGTAVDRAQAERWLAAADRQKYPLAGPSLQALSRMN